MPSSAPLLLLSRWLILPGVNEVGWWQIFRREWRRPAFGVPGMEESQIKKRFGGTLGPRRPSYLLLDEKCLWGVVPGLGLRLTSTWNVSWWGKGRRSEYQDFFTLPRMEIRQNIQVHPKLVGNSLQRTELPHGFRSQGYFVLGKSLSPQHIHLDLHVSLDFQECGWKQVHPFKA